MGIAEILEELTAERVQAQKELAKLDRAIAVLHQLSGTNMTPIKNGHKRTVSVAARRKMAKAQKARWAKVRAAQKRKG
jgi:hypothetical protein